jgi:hypothetical protein
MVMIGKLTEAEFLKYHDAMKKKPSSSFAEKFNTLGKVIACVLAYALFMLVLQQVDAPSEAQRDLWRYQ